MQPQYHHNCTSCRFLGNYRRVTFQKKVLNFDLYYCKPFDSVVARYGNNECDRDSVQAKTLKKFVRHGPIDEFEQGYKLAVEKGYIKTPPLEDIRSNLETRSRIFTFAFVASLFLICAIIFKLIRWYVVGI